VDSILDSVKKVLGIDKDYDAFDVDIVMHINTVFATLHQLGIGPEAGFAIEDASPTWEEYLGDDMRLNNIKTYIYMRVRIVFDPPTTGFLLTSMKEQIQELEWRISIRREGDAYVDPVPTTVVEPEVVIIPSSQAWYSE
jgi:hypothetical protein